MRPMRRGTDKTGALAYQHHQCASNVGERAVPIC
jgi:hypothetical protein